MATNGGRAFAVAALLMAAVPGAAAAQQTKLLFVPPATATDPFGDTVYKPWVDAVEKASDGSLAIDYRQGGGLVTLGNAFDRLMDDVVQITFLVPPNIAGRFPLTEVGGLPFMTEKSLDTSAAMWRLYKSGLLDAELRDLHPLMLSSFGYSSIHFVKPPRSLENLRGLKISAASKIQTDMIAALGGTPLSGVPSEVYASLQRGLYDGIMTSWAGFAAYKLIEVTSFHLDAPLGTTTVMLAMTAKRFAALPPRVQQALDKSSGEALSRKFGARVDEINAQQVAAVAAASGHIVADLSSQQMAAWRISTAPVVERWAASRANGDEVLAGFRRMLADVEAGH